MKSQKEGHNAGLVRANGARFERFVGHLERRWGPDPGTRCHWATRPNSKGAYCIL